MACPSVITGDRFLARVIEHVDCQSRELGTFGYLALGEPGSTASIVVASLLTLFIALFGIRLLFGAPVAARDVVMDVITIGIVLTLAFSWPAFRTLVHDVVLDGPGELASQMTPPTLAGANASFIDRLQAVDEAMTGLAATGTGRNVGQFIAEGESFRGSAVEDEAGFGYGRTLWLAGVIGVLAPLRLLAGVLLAIAPLAAVLLLFEASRGLFAGWMRGLVVTLVGTLGVTLMLALELAIYEPYLADALRARALGYATPSTPTELLALGLAFLTGKLVLVTLLARVAFQRGWLRTAPGSQATERTAFAQPRNDVRPAVEPAPSLPRAQVIARSVETRMAYEDGARGAARIPGLRVTGGPDVASGTSAPPVYAMRQDRLGQTGRRSAYRSSASARRRDAT